jgi:multimeric flavodoxin WrbA
MGSPREHGNTAELIKPFRKELEDSGASVDYILLNKLHIHPCRGCFHCQDAQQGYGCIQEDDMDTVVEAVEASDIIVLATPIYTWYCTTELKIVLDRFFGMAKFYRSASGNLLAGKRLCILATHGYEVSYAADPFVIGIQRMCQHYGMHYEGMYSVRDIDGLASFQTQAAQRGAKDFAQYLISISEGACPI